MSDSIINSVDTSTAESTPLEGHNEAPVANPNGVEVNKSPDNPTWYYDADLPGAGDRPEWLKDKYKTAADQAKAYADLEKKLGAFTGAPEEYDLSISDEEYKGVTFDKQNPVLQEFLATAKEQGVSQEFVSTLLKSYAKMQALERPNLDKEMERLGPNAKQDLQILAQWGSNTFSKEELNTFKDMVKTADQVKIFDKIRRLMTRAETVPTNTRVPVESAEKVRQLIHDPRYDTDEVFRKEVRAKLAQVLGE